MPKQHIAIVASAHPPGDVRVFKKLVLSFAQAGWDIEFVAPQLEPIPQMPENVRFHPIKPRRGYLQRFLNAKHIVNLIQPWQPSVVIFVDPELIWDMYWYKLRNPKTIVIFDRHENFNLLSKSLPGLSNYLSTLVYSWLEWWITPKLDAVIVVLDEMRNYLNPKTNTITVHNFPDRNTLSRFQTLSDINTHSESYTCVILGSFTANNALMEHLKLVDELVNHRKRNEFKLLIGGNIQASDIEKAQSFIKEKKLENNIKLVEKRIPHDEVIEYVKNSRIGLCTYLNNPNLKITLHNKVLESMAAGLPVITSPSSMNQKIVCDAGCGVTFWANEIDKIADQIEYWLDNPETAKTLGQKGQDYVQNFCVWERDFEKLNNWLLNKIKLV